MKDAAEFVARAFVRAIGRQDVAGLAALMTEGHRFVDSLGTAVEGREAMREAWMGYFRLVPDYSVEVESTLCDGPVVVLFGMARGTYAPDGTLRAENRWETPAALRAVIEDGKVAEWRVYADNEPIRRVIAKAGCSKNISE
jgi:ketosteroid isomerase-like protein